MFKKMFAVLMLVVFMTVTSSLGAEYRAENYGNDDPAYVMQASVR